MALGPRSALTPDALAMIEAIARTGSFAAAARELGKVPSAVTYGVRQLEDALDVLLFDRKSRQARITAAGLELLDEGHRLLEQMDAVANRVRRVATGWETQLSIVCDDVISTATMLELCESFYAGDDTTGGPPATRLRLRTGVLTGTWEALVSGRADLAIGVTPRDAQADVTIRDLGPIAFVFAVAPHHPLARATEPIADAEIVRHRAIAVADSAERLAPMTVHLLPGQDVLTVADMRSKIEAHVRGLGCGFLPEPMARACIADGRLVARAVQRQRPQSRLGYAWRAPSAPGSSRQLPLGLGLRWWLQRLDSAPTRVALIERHRDDAASTLRPASST